MDKNTVSNKKYTTLQDESLFPYCSREYHNAPSIYCELRKCYVSLKTLANKRTERKIQALTVVIIQK